MTVALACCTNVLADVLVAALFSVVGGMLVDSSTVVHSDVSDACLFVIDALDVSARLVGEVGAFRLRTLLPFVANRWALYSAECGLSADMAEFGARALVNRTLDTGTPFAPSSGRAINWAVHGIAAFRQQDSGACFASEHGLLDHLSSCVADTTTACFIADGPSRKRSHLAVDGAGRLTAHS